MDCLDRILYVYEERYHDENIPQTAIKILNDWIEDKIPMWEARKYCWTVLELARKMENEDKVYCQIIRATVYCQIIRATGHCLATCHVPTHAEGTAMYVISAIKHINKDKKDVIELMKNERKWQIEHLLDLRNSIN